MKIKSMFSIFTITTGVGLWVLFQGQMSSMPLILIAIGGVDRILDKFKKSQIDDTLSSVELIFLKEEVQNLASDLATNVGDINQKLADISARLSEPSTPSVQIEQLAESVQGISQGMAYILPVVKKTQDLYKAQGL